MDIPSKIRVSSFDLIKAPILDLQSSSSNIRVTEDNGHQPLKISNNSIHDVQSKIGSFDDGFPNENSTYENNEIDREELIITNEPIPVQKTISNKKYKNYNDTALTNAARSKGDLRPQDVAKSNKRALGILAPNSDDVGALISNDEDEQISNGDNNQPPALKSYLDDAFMPLNEYLEKLNEDPVQKERKQKYIEEALKFAFASQNLQNSIKQEKLLQKITLQGKNKLFLNNDLNNNDLKIMPSPNGDLANEDLNDEAKKRILGDIVNKVLQLAKAKDELSSEVLKLALDTTDFNLSTPEDMLKIVRQTGVKMLWDLEDLVKSQKAKSHSNILTNEQVNTLTMPQDNTPTNPVDNLKCLLTDLCKTIDSLDEANSIPLLTEIRNTLRKIHNKLDNIIKNPINNHEDDPISKFINDYAELTDYLDTQLDATIQQDTKRKIKEKLAEGIRLAWESGRSQSIDLSLALGGAFFGGKALGYLKFSCAITVPFAYGRIGISHSLGAGVKGQISKGPVDASLSIGGKYGKIHYYNNPEELLEAESDRILRRLLQTAKPLEVPRNGEAGILSGSQKNTSIDNRVSIFESRQNSMDMEGPRNDEAELLSGSQKNTSIDNGPSSLAPRQDSIIDNGTSILDSKQKSMDEVQLKNVSNVQPQEAKPKKPRGALARLCHAIKNIFSFKSNKYKKSIKKATMQNLLFKESLKNRGILNNFDELKRDSIHKRLVTQKNIKTFEVKASGTVDKEYNPFSSFHLKKPGASLTYTRNEAFTKSYVPLLTKLGDNLSELESFLRKSYSDNLDYVEDSGSKASNKLTSMRDQIDQESLPLLSKINPKDEAREIRFVLNNNVNENSSAIKKLGEDMNLSENKLENAPPLIAQNDNQNTINKLQNEIKLLLNEFTEFCNYTNFVGHANKGFHLKRDVASRTRKLMEALRGVNNRGDYFRKLMERCAALKYMVLKQPESGAKAVCTMMLKNLSMSLENPPVTLSQKHLKKMHDRQTLTTHDHTLNLNLNVSLPSPPVLQKNINSKGSPTFDTAVQFNIVMPRKASTKFYGNHNYGSITFSVTGDKLLQYGPQLVTNIFQGATNYVKDDKVVSWNASGKVLMDSATDFSVDVLHDFATSNITAQVQSAIDDSDTFKQSKNADVAVDAKIIDFSVAHQNVFTFCFLFVGDGHKIRHGGISVSNSRDLSAKLGLQFHAFHADFSTSTSVTDSVVSTLGTDTFGQLLQELPGIRNNNDCMKSYGNYHSSALVEMYDKCTAQGENKLKNELDNFMSHLKTQCGNLETKISAIDSTAASRPSNKEKLDKVSKICRHSIEFLKKYKKIMSGNENKIAGELGEAIKALYIMLKQKTFFDMSPKDVENSVNEEMKDLIIINKSEDKSLPKNTEKNNLLNNGNVMHPMSEQEEPFIPPVDKYSAILAMAVQMLDIENNL